METYRYEIWYDGCCIHEEREWETEEDARDDAEQYVFWECHDESGRQIADDRDYDIRIMEE